MPRTRNVSFYGPGQGPLGGDALRRDYQSDPRRRMEQQLMAQGSSTAPVQSPWEGITRALSGVAGGYFAGLSRRGWEAKEAAAAKEVNAILAALEPQLIPTPAPIPDLGGGDYEAANFVDGLYPPTHTGGVKAAIAVGKNMTSQRARALTQTLMINQEQQRQATEQAELSRRQTLIDANTARETAIELKQTPGGPNSPTGRPASGIQYKDEYERIKAGPGGQKAADAFLRDFVNQQWMNIGGSWVPRAGAGAGAPGPSVTIGLKPADEPVAAATKSEAAQTGKDIGAVNVKKFFGVQDAFNQRETIGKLITHINTSDAITGVGAEIFKNVNRVIAKFGSEAAAGKVSDTELLEAMLGSEVFPMIKTLGIGARGMDTPAEREFLLSVMTGKITLNKATLLKMAQIRFDIAERIIRKWNKRVDGGELDRFYEAAGIPKNRFDIDAPGETSDNLQDVNKKYSEEDILATMKANNMTRAQVLEALNGR
jgi:hypothetical protein